MTLLRRPSRLLLPALLMMALMISLAIAELVVRIAHLTPASHPEADTAIVLHYDDPNGWIRQTPNWAGYIGDEWTQINSDGFRDRLFSASPAPGTVRVAVVGDSYTMGDAVPLSSTYPRQLEDLLCRRHRCEVMNLGVSATNSSNQLEILKHNVLGYHPNVVVLGYNLNDFIYETQTRFDRIRDAGYQISEHADGRVTVSKDLSMFGRAKLAVRNRLYLWRWLASMKETWQNRRRQTEQYGSKNWYQNAMASNGHLKSFAAVSEMQRLCQERGITFLMFLLPDVLSVPPSTHTMNEYPFAEEHQMVVEQMRQRGIDVTDLLPAFANRKLAELEASPFNRHYSHEGNRIVANAMAGHVEETIGAIEKQAAAGTDK